MNGADPSAGVGGGGLAALLAGQVPAGTYRWTGAADDEAEVRRAVEHAGWRYAHLDGGLVGTKHELIEALGAALALRGLHGGNLDALEESLRTLAGPTVLVWDDWGPLARADRRTFTAVTALLNAPAAPRRGHEPRPATWVLLRTGPGGTGPGGLAAPDLRLAEGA